MVQYQFLKQLGKFGYFTINIRTKIQNTFQGVKSPHIDHIDFMNCQKLINDHKKNTLVYKNQNAVLEKERKLDQLIIKHLAVKNLNKLLILGLCNKYVL